MNRDEAKVVVETVARHLMDRIAQPPEVYPGVIKTVAGADGIARWVQDGTDTTHDIGVTDNVGVAVNKRCMVQFNPSGAAFVLQRI